MQGVIEAGNVISVLCNTTEKDMSSPIKRTSSRLSSSKTPTKKATPEKRNQRQNSSIQGIVSPTTEGYFSHSRVTIVSTYMTTSRPSRSVNQIEDRLKLLGYSVKHFYNLD